MHASFGGISLIDIIISCALAIVFHEIFHVIAARFLGVALYSFRITPLGIKARLKSVPNSFKKQTFIFFSGPLGNFLLALAFSFGNDFFRNLSYANLAIGLYNLLPIYPLDGGQIFIIVFYKLMGGSKTFRLIKRLSIVMKIGMALAGLVQVLIFKNPSLLVAAAMLPGTKLLEETVRMIKLSNLLNRRQRIINKKIYGVRHLIATEDCTLMEIMQKLDYDRFHIIYILDNDMEVIGQITEQQLIKALQTCKGTDRVCDVFFLGL